MSVSHLDGLRDSPTLPSTDLDRCSVPLPPLPRQEHADADRGTPPPRGSSSASGDGMLLEEHQLVAGYLAAVAMQLDQRGLVVRETHSTTANSDTLAGHLSLAPSWADPVRWAPAQLDWSEHHGWSATLLPLPTGGSPADRAATNRTAASRGVVRYLPRQIVPAPVTVAHFAAALNTHENTVWANAVYRQQRCMDRRLLILRLSQFGLPEPW